ncbi:hypothetical protein [uncultured Tyzzerella sp.]|uniref:hypothetical protein n=1 Tax=uncultured Tyzzerella sp. TaxID=2321398 RepID=UPI0029422C77|nr:hypothetical protein [uncultured Tyzzerella sp.]
MAKHCRYLLSLKTLIGIILASIGLGMLLVLIIPWWGYILALGLFIGGLCLIFFNK